MADQSPASVPTRQDVDRWIEELRAELWPSPSGQEVCDGLMAYIAELREAAEAYLIWDQRSGGAPAKRLRRALTGPDQEANRG